MVRDLEAVKLLLSTYEQTRENSLQKETQLRLACSPKNLVHTADRNCLTKSRKEARTRFNAKKQKDLEDVVARGKANNVSIENHKG